MNFRMVHSYDIYYMDMSYLGRILGEFLLKMCKEEKETADSIPETRHGQGLLVAHARALERGSSDKDANSPSCISPPG